MNGRMPVRGDHVSRGKKNWPVLPDVTFGLTEGVNKLIESYICFVDLCASIKDDIVDFMVVDILPGVQAKVCIDEVIWKHEHLIVV